MIKESKMKKVAIIGAGLMGTALAWPLSDNGHEIRLVGTHLDNEIISSCKDNQFHPKLGRQLPENVFPFYIKEISDALNGIDFIVNGVNSMGVHWIGKTLSPFIKPGDKIISVTKGIEANGHDDLIILPDILKKELPKNIRNHVEIAAIGGPCIANELADRRLSCVVFAAENNDTVEYFREVLQTKYYHVWVTSDIVGLEISAALKNAYAMGVGLAEGFLVNSGGVENSGSSMYNLAAALFAQGCNEVCKFLKIMGVSESFSINLPIVGDQFVTCQKGRSYRLGVLLGKGIPFNQAAEMMQGETLESALVVNQMEKILSSMVGKGVVSIKEFPLMRLLIDLICFQKPVHFEFDDFFK
jgi:glycerol-3-phosphate dehydrogenase (NAD(P)+)